MVGKSAQNKMDGKEDQQICAEKDSGATKFPCLDRKTSSAVVLRSHGWQYAARKTTDIKQLTELTLHQTVEKAQDRKRWSKKIADCLHGSATT